MAAALLWSTPVAVNADSHLSATQGEESVFTDISSAYWAYNEIDRMRTLDIFQGYADGTFRPSNSITRMQTIITAVRLLGLEEEANAKDFSTPVDFKDAENYFGKERNQWAKGYVLVAIEEGLLYENGERLDPNKPAERLWVASVLIRALGYEEEAQELMSADVTFKDKEEIPKDAAGYAVAAEKYGIFSGSSNGEFQPSVSITRAQMATVLDRTYKKLLANPQSKMSKDTFIYAEGNEEKIKELIRHGESYQGAEYLFGADPSSTEFFDCSSFTKKIYGEIGITLPRTSRSQFQAGEKIEQEELQTGDLVFFDTNEDEGINHVAVFINEETLLHATRSKGVDYTAFTDYWKKYYTGAVRVIEQ